ncbi:MAG TPA: iron donor protein CyaY [Bryobacteraceae bacterium]|nr:iron donor protein CyaY [Bryobacteraceae bacterium]
MLDDQAFQLKSDEALRTLYNALVKASDEHGFDTDYGGALTVEFEDPPAKFVVSPNAPVKQIWVSAHMKSFKLDWDAARGEFVLADSGRSLTQLMEDAVSQQLGDEVKL